VEDGARGVEGLKLVLDIERRENVLGVADGQVRRVGVVGGVVARPSSSNNTRVGFYIMLG